MKKKRKKKKNKINGEIFFLFFFKKLKTMSEYASLGETDDGWGVNYTNVTVPAGGGITALSFPNSFMAL